jgi:4-hydroxybutyrate CoA-transferase
MSTSQWEKMYHQKLSSAEEIVSQINSDSLCASACALGEPVGLSQALAVRAEAENLTGISHHLLLVLKDLKYLQPDMTDKMKHVSWFTSGYARKPVQNGSADFMPCFYKDAPMLWQEFVKPDVFYATVSPMDKHGWFSFGVAASVARAAMSRADKTFLEVNRHMPRAHGTGVVHISEVDAISENHSPLVELAQAPITPKDEIVGNLIAEHIPDGATIQFGIGSIPNAVGQALKNKKNLGVHSEMFTETMVDLIECGAINNLRKQINPNKSISCFAIGSRRMYDFIDDNPGIEFHSIDYVNDPTVIGQHDNFISINATIEVDLIGQACSESIGTRQFSGTGGQVDFIRGAGMSKDGKSFLAIHSTAKNDTISKIKPVLTMGAHVTCSKNEIDYFATEYGIVRLKGKTASQRAKALISIAHPNFREELTQSARQMHLIA